MTGKDVHERGRMLTHTPRGEVIPLNTPDQRRRAARRIATEAANADEFAELLDMLGLNAVDGLQPTDA